MNTLRFLSVALALSSATGFAADPAPAVVAKPHHSYGWKEDAAGKHAASIVNLYHFSATPIAPSSDLRGKMPDIYDQGQLGSCTGNGIAAVLDYAHFLKAGKFATPSRLFVYYNERAKEGTINEDAGAQISDGIDVVTSLGASTEKLWPYTIAKFKTKPTKAAFTEGLKYQAVHAYKCDNTNGTDIRRALSLGFPVVFGCYVYSEIENLDLFHQTLPLPKSGEKPLGGHCLVIVGHDDAKQVYIVRNSWGTIWGKQGYAYFPYQYVHNGRITSDCWVIDVAE
ncbi:MAG: peptidase [Verrucomicrobiaceae bacterium]|nr:peptidase [Verrucomicrobiaceae bacterium]